MRDPPVARHAFTSLVVLPAGFNDKGEANSADVQLEVFDYAAPVGVRTLPTLATALPMLTHSMLQAFGGTAQDKEAERLEAALEAAEKSGTATDAMRTEAERARALTGARMQQFFSWVDEVLPWLAMPSSRPVSAR